jgi:hypothetical protein
LRRETCFCGRRVQSNAPPHGLLQDKVSFLPVLGFRQLQATGVAGTGVALYAVASDVHRRINNLQGSAMELAAQPARLGLWP